MNDRIVIRACRAGARSVPVDKDRNTSRRKTKEPIAPDEIAAAIEMARGDRIEDDVREYAQKKRERA